MTRHRAACLFASAGLCASIASAQPSIVLVGNIGGTSGDVSADGNSTVGVASNFESNLAIPARFTRGQGVTLTNGVFKDATVSCSSDASVLNFVGLDQENLNGFGTNRYSPHRWTSATGVVNLGNIPGGFRCDFTSATVNDTSGNGRYCVGGGWTASLCGPLRAWLYDAQTSAYTILPVSFSGPPFNVNGITRGDSVNSDGTVVCGYDQNYNPTNTATVRRAAVWEFFSGSWHETILDPWGGTAVNVSADGNVIVGKMSSTTMIATFGTSVLTPVRWVRSSPGVWTAQNLFGTGSMAATNCTADGSTVIGVNGGGGFIWRADINGGIAYDLYTYASDLGAVFPNLSFGALLGSPIWKISDNGAAIMVSVFDTHSNACFAPPNKQALLYLDGTTCEAPRLAMPVASWALVAGPTSFGTIVNIDVSGSWPMAFQWQKETSPGVWTDLSDDSCGQTNSANFDVHGSTTWQLRLGKLTGVYAGRYRCNVSNSCGSITSNISTVADCPSLGIDTQPQPASVAPGAAAQFSVTPSGGGLYTYQWQKDGANIVDGPTGTGSIIVGAAFPTVRVVNASASDVGSYTCIVTNPCGNTTTNGASLAIATPCYANCNGNTDAPLLTAADFTCFLNKFRAGDPYANCNGNTDAPLLTAADFTCYLTKFRAGCP